MASKKNKNAWTVENASPKESVYDKVARDMDKVAIVKGLSDELVKIVDEQLSIADISLEEVKRYQVRVHDVWARAQSLGVIDELDAAMQ